MTAMFRLSLCQGINGDRDSIIRMACRKAGLNHPYSTKYRMALNNDGGTPTLQVFLPTNLTRDPDQEYIWTAKFEDSLNQVMDKIDAIN